MRGDGRRYGGYRAACFMFARISWSAGGRSSRGSSPSIGATRRMMLPAVGAAFQGQVRPVVQDERLSAGSTAMKVVSSLVLE